MGVKLDLPQQGKNGSRFFLETGYWEENLNCRDRRWEEARENWLKMGFIVYSLNIIMVIK
jgi:hypothetical protein